jgi:hypothetical protein
MIRCIWTDTIDGSSWVIPECISLSRSISFILSFSPVLSNLNMIVSRIESALFCRSASSILTDRVSCRSISCQLLNCVVYYQLNAIVSNPLKMLLCIYLLQRDKLEYCISCRWYSIRLPLPLQSSTTFYSIFQYLSPSHTSITPTVAIN